MASSDEVVYRAGPMTSSTSSFSLGVEASNDSKAPGSDIGVAGAGAASTTSSSTTADSNAAMNEKVQAMASAIYGEFESMMGRYDADVVKNLMPLVVNVLENMDLGYTEKQELEVEVELLKEDNEQLVTQYEREKALRKASDQRHMESEDAAEGERKEAEMKVESLTSIVKMFELKAKNSHEQISRLDEKDAEMKREYAKLHDRYTELFKTHIDSMERTKSAIGQERFEQLQGMGTARNRIPNSLAVNNRGPSAATPASGPVSFGYSELENNNGQMASIISTAGGADFGSGKPSTLKNELKSPGAPPADSKGKDGGWMQGATPASTPTVAGSEELVIEEAEDVSSDPSVGPATPMTPVAPKPKGLKAETRTGNTLYQELSFQDSDAIGDVDVGADISDNESEFADSKDRGFDNVNDNYFGMGKEVENLITENNELLATKNALNIVKDDLIAKVDELTGEHEILREEIKSLQFIRSRLEGRVRDLEDEIKKAKEEAEEAARNAAKAAGTEEDEDVPMAQRKRFTRVEMARVLMERNQYKERFMELQEAVRWTEMIRASKTDPNLAATAAGTNGGQDKKGQKSIWKFFGNLFSGGGSGAGGEDQLGPYAVNMRYDGGGGSEGESVGPALTTMRNKSASVRRAAGSSRGGTDIFDGDNLSTENRRMSSAAERKEQYKQVRAHVKKDDGRMQAYGWSLPAKQPSDSAAASTPSTASGGKSPSEETQVQSRTSSSGVPVPVPVYCRPLMEREPGMKIWCAAGVIQSGGRTKDGGDVVGASVFYSDPPKEAEGHDKASSAGSPTGAQEEGEDAVAKLDSELQSGKRLVEEAVEAEQSLSSHVWICTSTHASSKVTVIDANSPADVLESFHVCSSHLLCVASVAGARESDYRVDEELNRLVVEESDRKCREHEEIQKAKEEVEATDAAGGDGDGGKDNTASSSRADFASISFVSCATATEKLDSMGSVEEPEEEETKPRLTKETAFEIGSKVALDRTMDVFKLQELSDDPDPNSTLPFISHHTLNISRELDDGGKANDAKDPKAPGSRSSTPSAAAAAPPGDETTTTDAVHRRFSRDANAQVKDGVREVSRSNEIAYSEVEKMSSVLPTMWLGSQSGSVYVHSAVSQWKRCIHSIRLKDSVLCIVHVKGRVLAALANGSIAIFHRSPSDGQWDLTNYHLLDLGKPRQSIRCMIQVHDMVWCGYGNRIHVIDPRTMGVVKTFDAHPRKESQVRQMAWVGDGVWVSIRLDSTLRLYHAHTIEHLQDVDIEPYVSKMLGTGKLGFSFVRITSLLVSNYRLWMGTGNGVIISVPLNHPQTADSRQKAAIEDALAGDHSSEAVEVYQDSATKRVMAESFVPYCNMSQAQLSFHGHRDAVKFFVSVPGHGGLALNPTSSASPVKSRPGSSTGSVASGGGGFGSNADPATSSSMLVMSGGEGYIDFRIGDTVPEESTEKRGLSRGERSHLIVWQVPILRKKRTKK